MKTITFEKDYFEGKKCSNYKNYSDYSQMKPRSEAFYKWCAKKGLLPIPNANILEIGCAYGYYLAEFKEKNFNTYGIDVSNYAIDIANKQLNNIKGFHTVQVSSATEILPFDDNFFDFIYSLDTIEHVEKPEDFIKQLWRVLKPNSYCLIVTPNKKSQWWVDKVFGPDMDPTHISIMNNIELKQKIEYNNIKNSKIEIFNWEKILNDYSLKYKIARFGFKLIDLITQPLGISHYLVAILKK